MDVRQIGRELISDAEFNHLLMSALEWAGQYMDGEEFISPHLMAFYAQADGNYGLSVFVTPGFEDDESKASTMVTMGAKAAELDGAAAGDGGGVGVGAPTPDIYQVTRSLFSGSISVI